MDNTGTIQEWFPTRCAAVDSGGRMLTNPDHPLSWFCENCRNAPRGGKRCAFPNLAAERRRWRAELEFGLQGHDGVHNLFQCAVPLCGLRVKVEGTLCGKHSITAKNRARWHHISYEEAVEWVIDGMPEEGFS